MSILWRKKFSRFDWLRNIKIQNLTISFFLNSEKSDFFSISVFVQMKVCFLVHRVSQQKVSMFLLCFTTRLSCFFFSRLRYYRHEILDKNTISLFFLCYNTECITDIRIYSRIRRPAYIKLHSQNKSNKIDI
jgi:hypothetical protein